MVGAIVSATTMTVSKAHEIHEAWNKAGSAPCRHGFADPLESDDGIDMGTNVCAICGSHTPGLPALPPLQVSVSSLH
jgi:hypothetical protein